jgi:membrane protease YdiL (CAAX protease family)
VTIKRLILALLTLFAIAKVILSLGESFNQPQVQSRLELYQTNLVLQASEFVPDLAEDNSDDLRSLQQAIIGDNPYEAAQKQYTEAREEAKTTRNKLQTQFAASDILTPPVQATEVPQSRRNQLQTEVFEVDKFIHQIDLQLGLLQAQQGQVETALTTWESLTQTPDIEADVAQTARVLAGLWQSPPKVLPNSEAIINDNLKRWFQGSALQQLYTVQTRPDDLETSITNTQSTAQSALLKLGIISGIPALAGLTGMGLLVFLVIQWAIKGKDSTLATNAGTRWETPWDWEIVWQVLIVGFFFFGQFVLPLIFGLSGFNPGELTIRGKSVYVLVSYLMMAIGGLLILYFSIRRFLPLPKDQDWFNLKPTGNWFLWGFGGYLVALPCVVVVSLINQQIWQGQGGSNPILFLALQAQDQVALAIFFSTASIAAPIFEEAIFRGFLLSSLTRYVPVWGAILISSLIFSVAHLSLAEVLPLTTLGIVLGVVYTRSRNLLAPILLHSLWNSGTLFSLFILGSQ